MLTSSGWVANQQGRSWTPATLVLVCIAQSWNLVAANHQISVADISNVTLVGEPASQIGAINSSNATSEVTVEITLTQGYLLWVRATWAFIESLLAILRSVPHE